MSDRARRFFKGTDHKGATMHAYSVGPEAEAMNPETAGKTFGMKNTVEITEDEYRAAYGVPAWAGGRHDEGKRAEEQPKGFVPEDADGPKPDEGQPRTEAGDEATAEAELREGQTDEIMEAVPAPPDGDTVAAPTKLKRTPRAKTGGKAK